LAAAGPLAAGAAASAPLVPAKIDIHHHIVAPPWLAAYRESLAGLLRTNPAVANWTIAAALEQLDRFGIRTAFTSMSSPNIWGSDIEAGRRLARACNEFAARDALDHPGRFGFFANIPLPDVESSLTEAVYALDVLKADGIGMLTSYDDKWAGDSSFFPVFDELNRRKVTVFVHPADAACCATVVPGVPQIIEEYLFSTTRAITSLLVSGVFTRYPDIRFIFTHAGGTMPMAAGRIAGLLAARPDLADRFPRGPMYELGRQYYDVTSSTYAPNLAAAMRFAAPGHLLYGTDYPWVAIEETDRNLTAGGLDSGTLSAIFADNARELMPRVRR
jgi:predicted TIM-barrel fold metal-dependent hydrolase